MRDSYNPADINRVRSHTGKGIIKCCRPNNNRIHTTVKLKEINQLISLKPLKPFLLTPLKKAN